MGVRLRFEEIQNTRLGALPTILPPVLPLLSPFSCSEPPDETVRLSIICSVLMWTLLIIGFLYIFFIIIFSILLVDWLSGLLVNQLSLSVIGLTVTDDEQVSVLDVLKGYG